MLVVPVTRLSLTTRSRFPCGVVVVVVVVVAVVHSLVMTG